MIRRRPQVIAALRDRAAARPGRASGRGRPTSPSAGRSCRSSASRCGGRPSLPRRPTGCAGTSPALRRSVRVLRRDRQQQLLDQVDQLGHPQVEVAVLLDLGLRARRSVRSSSLTSPPPAASTIARRMPLTRRLSSPLPLRHQSSRRPSRRAAGPAGRLHLRLLAVNDNGSPLLELRDHGLHRAPAASSWPSSRRRRTRRPRTPGRADPRRAGPSRTAATRRHARGATVASTRWFGHDRARPGGVRQPGALGQGRAQRQQVHLTHVEVVPGALGCPLRRGRRRGHEVERRRPTAPCRANHSASPPRPAPRSTTCDRHALLARRRTRPARSASSAPACPGCCCACAPTRCGSTRMPRNQPLSRQHGRPRRVELVRRVGHPPARPVGRPRAASPAGAGPGRCGPPAWPWSAGRSSPARTAHRSRP